MPVTGLGNSKPAPGTIPSVPEDVALRFEPVFPDAHRPSIRQGTLPACLNLLAPDCCATPVRICTLRLGRGCEDPAEKRTAPSAAQLTHLKELTVDVAGVCGSGIAVTEVMSGFTVSADLDWTVLHVTKESRDLVHV